MVGKMVFDRDCERRRKGILTKLSNIFKMRKASFHCSTRFCSSLSLSLWRTVQFSLLIDSEGEKSREQIRQKGGRKRLDFLREILFANVGDINKWSPDKKIRTVARKDFPARNAFTWHLIFLATSLSSFFPFFPLFFLHFFPPIYLFRFSAARTVFRK